MRVCCSYNVDLLYVVIYLLNNIPSLCVCGFCLSYSINQCEVAGNFCIVCKNMHRRNQKPRKIRWIHQNNHWVRSHHITLVCFIHISQIFTRCLQLKTCVCVFKRARNTKRPKFLFVCVFVYRVFNLVSCVPQFCPCVHFLYCWKKLNPCAIRICWNAATRHIQSHTHTLRKCVLIKSTCGHLNGSKKLVYTTTTPTKKQTTIEINITYVWVRSAEQIEITLNKKLCVFCACFVNLV